MMAAMDYVEHFRREARSFSGAARQAVGDDVAPAPMRRARSHVPPGHGERFRFTRADGPGDWAVRFDTDIVVLAGVEEACDVAIAGTASDLMLFLWHRVPLDALDVAGDTRLADSYFDFVPPL
jgi:hypothetical protein